MIHLVRQIVTIPETCRTAALHGRISRFFPKYDLHILKLMTIFQVLRGIAKGIIRGMNPGGIFS